MRRTLKNIYGSTLRRRVGPKTMRGGIALLSAVLVVGAAGVAFAMRFNLSTAGSLELLLVVLIALRWGRIPATIASVVAVFCLNYLFMPPIFRLTVADPGNWVSLLTFESTALLVGALSSKARINAAQADLQRQRTAKLYELSRAILLLDWGSSTSGQLDSLIREMVGVESVLLGTRISCRKIRPNRPIAKEEIATTSMPVSPGASSVWVRHRLVQWFSAAGR
jgi:two-component system, OmpR family, sensor histidine kinase KdpD